MSYNSQLEIMKKDKLKKKVTYESVSVPYIPPIKLKEIPPEKAFAILRKAGYDITEQQSEEIMQFLYIIVKITLKEFFASD
ncbi:Uncharacterised protein [Chryseobacterium indoltheticum]|uniref:Uncharacterized protein n=2 Tax=Chryseobacterium indoltheticum TaxID=254 RepID=A0A381FR86_9FLAO|nr:Uncharacterised protein [Chryseobacterium indoltheticum]